MCALPKGSTGVAVDLPGGLWGTSKSPTHLRRAIANLGHRGYKCSTVFGDSHTAATKRLIVGRGPYDAILIDGDHTLEGVTRDWELYGELAPIVAFHDIVGTGQYEKVNGKPVEVPLLWAELKKHRQCLEFIGTDSRMGIGVVCNFTS